MGRVTECNSEKRDRWRQLIDQWQHGDKTRREICEEAGVSVRSFAYWKRQLTDSDATSPVLPGFAVVEVRSRSCDLSGVRIACSNGLHVEVASDFNEETLRRVLRVIT